MTQSATSYDPVSERPARMTSTAQHHPRRIRRMPTSAPRTLADQFRSWPDEQLSALLEARPDLATPAPHDSSQLAARVVVKASVLRALDGLDALELTVLQALVQGTDPADLPATPEAVAGAVERLASLALVWGSPTRPVLVVGDLLRLPAGSPVRRGGRPAGGSGPARPGDPRPPRGEWRRRTLERRRRPDRRPGRLRPAGPDRRAPRDDPVVGAARAADAPAAGSSTSHRCWPPPSAGSRWSTGPRPARPSSWYDAPSCSSTAGAPTPRRR